ncbi:hypothetical protein LCGC14_1478080 [marine sediment metagenome]|uniref:Uncharacterized protein n=1 Tax=marine sediment metagenome TaxID=412755 RepID=A0A0F9JB08_9ZZZZ
MSEKSLKIIMFTSLGIAAASIVFLVLKGGEYSCHHFTKFNTEASHQEFDQVVLSSANKMMG